MNLSNLERETIILFNEAEGAAQIETFNPRLLRQLRKVATCEGVSCTADEKGYGVYTVPKTMIKIHAPRTLQLTDDERQEAARRLKLGRDKARQNQF